MLNQIDDQPFLASHNCRDFHVTRAKFIRGRKDQSHK